MKASRVLLRPKKGVPALRPPPRVQFHQAACAMSPSTRALRRSHESPLQTKTTAAPNLPARSRRAYTAEAAGKILKTDLHDLHVRHGAKMVPFGGYSMPVQYGDQSLSASHLHTRARASVFDVGHMVQHTVEGPGATAFLERFTPAGCAALPPHTSTLSAILWPGTGGIVDDTMITKLGGADRYFVVTNAACRDKDLAFLAKELQAWSGPPVTLKTLDDKGLVALQGPLSERVLAGVVADPAAAAAGLRGLLFGQCRFLDLKADGGALVKDVLVSRGGYTGEDGFELSIPGAATEAVTEALLKHPDVKLAGLGARDSLRLEAGLCLYGHDLDDSTTPAEGALGWIVAKTRRGETDVSKGAFYGADVVLAQLTPKSKGGAGVERRRVGLFVDGAPAREGAEILAGGEKVGVVTSGCPSPTLGRNIAMGYVKFGLHKEGTALKVRVRGKERGAVVTKMPFVPTKYWKGETSAT
ncbi:glycine cleavage system T protein [Jackrogersella minutella]|nr:glycine cleavage system T protein [Jackrogersella minutella]